MVGEGDGVRGKREMGDVGGPGEGGEERGEEIGERSGTRLEAALDGLEPLHGQEQPVLRTTVTERSAFWRGFEVAKEESGGESGGEGACLGDEGTAGTGLEDEEAGEGET